MSTSGAARNISRLELRTKARLNLIEIEGKDVRFFESEPIYTIVMTDEHRDHTLVTLPADAEKEVSAKYEMMRSLGASFDARQDYLWTVVDKYRGKTNDAD